MHLTDRLTYVIFLQNVSMETMLRAGHTQILQQDMSPLSMG